VLLPHEQSERKPYSGEGACRPKDGGKPWDSSQRRVHKWMMKHLPENRVLEKKIR